MNQSITELLYVTREVSWLPWAVQYFFLIGLSIGCLLVSLPGQVFLRPGWAKAGRLALIGALVCGLVAPVALLSDLHQPGRFVNFYLHPQASSWMSWGSFFIPFYLAALIAYAWACLRPDLAAACGGRLTGLYRRLGGRPSPSLVRITATLAVIAGGLVALYTGTEVMVVTARPLWHTPLLPFQFLATAVAGALGLVLIFNHTLGDRDPALDLRLNRALSWTLGAVMALGLAWFGAALSGLAPGHATALAEVSGSPAWRLTAGWAAAATLLPMTLAWQYPVRSAWLTGLIAVHSAWMMRWTVFIGGQTIPKTGAGLYGYSLPLGPEGLLGIAGTAGLWVFALIALTNLLPPAASAQPTNPRLPPFQGA